MSDDISGSLGSLGPPAVGGCNGSPCAPPSHGGRVEQALGLLGGHRSLSAVPALPRRHDERVGLPVGWLGGRDGLSFGRGQPRGLGIPAGPPSAATAPPGHHRAVSSAGVAGAPVEVAMV